MIMPTSAATTKHLRTLWRGEKPWEWAALYRGHSETRDRIFRLGRQMWQLHLTPIHLTRDGDKWTAGLCWGRRTLYVARHR